MAVGRVNVGGGGYKSGDIISHKNIEIIPNTEWSLNGLSSGSNSTQIVAHSDGFIYSAGQNYVRKISTEGETIWSTYVSKAIGIDIDNNNILYVASDKSIYKFDLDGNQIEYFYKSVNLLNVVVDSEGNIYSGTSDGRIIKMDFNGDTVWTFTRNTDRIPQLKLHPNGHLYSGSNDKSIKKIDLDGNEIWSIRDRPTYIKSLVVDSREDIYYGENYNHVRKIDKVGNYIWTYALSSMAYAVALDSYDNVYVGNNNGRVYKINSRGEIQWTYNANEFRINSIIVWSDMEIYNSNEYNKINKFTIDYKIIK